MKRFLASSDARTHGRSALLGLAQILVWGGSFFLLAVVGEPVAVDTGWSLQWVYGGLSVGIFISGLLAPRVGLLIQKVGGRTLLCSSGLLVAAGLLVLAISPHILVFFLGWTIIGVGMAAGLYDALFAVVSEVYKTKARTAITAITLVSGFCTTLVWPLLGVLIHLVGWRYCCALYALLLVLTVWPLYAYALPKTVVPEARAGVRKSSTSTLHGGTYLLICSVFTLAAVLMTAVSIQFISLLQARGYSLAGAIGLSALLGPSQVLSRVVDVAAGRRHPIWTTLASTALVAIGLLLIVVAPTAAAVGVVLYGAGNGLRAIVRGTLPLVLVSADQYAALMGRLARPALLGQAVTPLLAGLVLQKFGSLVSLGMLSALAVLNVLLVTLLLKRMK